MAIPSVPSIVLEAQGTILSSVGLFALLWPKRYHQLPKTKDSTMVKVFSQVPAKFFSCCFATTTLLTTAASMLALSLGCLYFVTAYHTSDLAVHLG